MVDLADNEREVKCRFFIRYRCVKCEHMMDSRDVMCSLGVCPYCGHISRGTVCRTKQSSARVVKRQRRLLGLFWWTTDMYIEECENE